MLTDRRKVRQISIQIREKILKAHLSICCSSLSLQPTDPPMCNHLLKLSACFSLGAPSLWVKVPDELLHTSRSCLVGWCVGRRNFAQRPSPFFRPGQDSTHFFCVQHVRSVLLSFALNYPIQGIIRSVVQLIFCFKADL